MAGGKGVLGSVGPLAVDGVLQSLSEKPAEHLRANQISADGLKTPTRRQVAKNHRPQRAARLHPAAAHSVLAHMIQLVREGRVQVDGEPTVDAGYRLA